MNSAPADVASRDHLSSRFSNAIHSRWGAVRALWDGLKLAKASAFSVLIGLLMFYAVPQVQDLFLEVRGSALMGSLFWLLFYVAILVGWALPVYVSSRWVLARFQRNPQARAEAGELFVEDWVRRAVPPLLAALCLVAVLVGQLASLGNAPTVVELAEMQKRGEQLRSQCPDDNIKTCGVVKYAASVAQFFTVLFAGWVGSERLILAVYTMCAIVAGWLFLPMALRCIRTRGWRIAAWIIWWTLSLAVILPIAVVVASAIYGLVRVEVDQKLNLGHLILLPLTTAVAAALVWWALRQGPGEQPTRMARLLMRLAGNDASTDQATATSRLLNPIFFTLLGVTMAIVLLLLVAHPVHTTSYIYRAIMVPFLLGLLVPVFTYLTYWSARWRAPIIFTIILLVAIFAARFADTHDVRTIETSMWRDNLDDSVRRWAAVNGCEPKATDAARACPQPIIVAAAGGASRAAFLVGSLMGKLLDEKTVAVLEGHEEDLQRAAFAPDGQRIVTQSERSTRLWDSTGAGEIAALEGNRALFSHDGRRVLTNAPNGRLWDAATGKAVAALGTSEINSAEFSPDGRRILTAFVEGTAQLWDADTGKPIGGLIGEENLGSITSNPAEKRAGFSPDGKRFVAAQGKTARIVDAETGNSVGEPLLHPETITSAAFTSNGRHVVVISTEEAMSFFPARTARLWDAQTGKEAAVLKVSGSKIGAISRDGRRLLTVSSQNALRLWDVEGAKEVGAFPAQTTSLDYALFSADGFRLVTTNFNETWLWDGQSGQAVAQLAKEQMETIAFSLDGKRLFTGRYEGSSKVWDAITGKQVVSWKMPGFLRSAAFAQSNEQVLTASNNMVRISNGQTGAEVAAFVATASERQKIKAGGQPLRPFGKQLFAVSGVSGGALSTVVTYAALADSQLKERASNGPGNPPCVREYGDNQWFAPHVRAGVATPADPRDPTAGVWQPHESWKGCLQLILAGDFLSPVFISLMSDDLLQLGFRGDRAATLEQAWEMRYAQMTGQSKIAPRYPSLERSTLGHPMGYVRHTVHQADPGNWLPVLLLNGTSVSTGRRIVASDVKMHSGDISLASSMSRSSSDAKAMRPFRDAYDLQDMMRVQFDIRLSTGATMSARFPVISPHGNLRDKEEKNRLSDRIVDGGYYENFGAITAMEMVQVLRSHGLKPFVVVVNNEPQLTGMDCVTADSRLPRPEPPGTVTFSTLSSPLNALLATGGGRATLAAVQLCSDVGQDNFAFITVQRDRHNPKKALSMSWWLSMHVQKYLDDQLELDGINKAAFAKIRSVRH